MKEIIKNTVLNILKILAKKRLKYMSPKVIGVSGSVGKTSTKEAIYHILSTKYKVIRSQSSYNTDFGIYLTILEESSGLSSMKSWIKILLNSFIKVFFIRKKIDFLILEMGTDQPNDMDVLLKILVPDIAVMTRISENHLEKGQFTSLEQMFNEDVKLQKAVIQKGGVIIMNSDDKYQQDYISSVKSNKNFIYFSLEEQVGGYDQILSTIENLEFDIKIVDEKHKIISPILGKWHVEVLLPAILLGIHLEIDIKDIQKSLLSFKLPAGRMSLIKGKNNTTIIDSSYNASPIAVKNALNLLGEIEAKRKVFVFGNMNELGEKSEEFHLSTYEYILKNVDVLITVGNGPRLAGDKAVESGFNKDNFYTFDDAVSASNFYDNIREKGDLILVKGSQNKVRLEKFIELQMENPNEAKEILVRQSSQWKKK